MQPDATETGAPRPDIGSVAIQDVVDERIVEIPAPGQGGGTHDVMGTISMQGDQK